MPTTDTPAPVLTPRQFREMKEISGLTFTQLAKSTAISRSQLCEYARGIRNLRPAQIKRCETALRKAMVEHGQRIAKLVSGEAA
jgi:hypothetical protein